VKLPEVKANLRKIEEEILKRDKEMNMKTCKEQESQTQTSGST